jgi:TatA/E family protein of Tat protein translocase
MGLGNLSGGELVILLVICLLVFGANRLPEAGRAVGKGLREFTRAWNEARDAVEPGRGGGGGGRRRRSLLHPAPALAGCSSSAVAG